MRELLDVEQDIHATQTAQTTLNKMSYKQLKTSMQDKMYKPLMCEHLDVEQDVYATYTSDEQATHASKSQGFSLCTLAKHTTDSETMLHHVQFIRCIKN